MLFISFRGVQIKPKVGCFTYPKTPAIYPLEQASVTPSGQWDYERRARDRGSSFRLFWRALVASETLRRITLVLGLICVGLMYYDISNVLWAAAFFVIWIITTVGAKLTRRPTGL
jgi:hypothetical protein